jgi:hypothetical protein
MARQSPADKPSPPEWWKPSLYRYLEKLTLAGWVWEFMRRDRLKMLRPEQPVDVMNPDNESDDTIPWHLRFYYRSSLRWPLPRPILTVPSAVRWKGVTPPAWQRFTYHNLTDYELEDEAIRQDPLPPGKWVQIEIDINRADPVILRDLDIALKEARKTYGKAPRANPRKDVWIEKHILEVWDLRELGVPVSKIIDETGMFGEEFKNKDERALAKQAAYNAYNRAKKRIEGKGWQLLALHADEMWPDVKIGG